MLYTYGEHKAYIGSAYTFDNTGTQQGSGNTNICKFKVIMPTSVFWRRLKQQEQLDGVAVQVVENL